MNIRNILCYFACKYNGDWNDIYSALKNKESIDEELYAQIFKKIKSKVLTIVDDEYPEQLKNIEKPPFVLFYYGNKEFLKCPMISVIGTRKASLYGIRATRLIVKSLVDNNYVIVSGLAKGIDGFAHQTALDCK